MSKGQKFLTYATGFVLGCLILMLIPRKESQQKEHPWHAQTSPEGNYPMTLVDDLGREVTLVRQPRHFISLAPSITEILFAMEMGDHLMAVTQWCNYPAEAKALKESGAHIGSMDKPDREAIAAYRPDLILGTDFTAPDVYAALENPPRTVAVALSHGKMDDILDDIGTIGKITGVPGKALALVREMKARRRQVEERIQPVIKGPRKQVLFLLSVEEGGHPGWAPGEDAWVTDLITASHADNVAAQIGQSWGEVSFETLLSLDPQILLIREAESPEAQANLEAIVEKLPEHPVWKQVRAIRDKRIHWIPYGPLSIPGPRVMEAYDSIASAIWELD